MILQNAECVENVNHIVSEWNELAQNEYMKLRHDKVVALLHWQLIMNYRAETYEKYYEHFDEKEMRVLENDKVKILPYWPTNWEERKG